MSLEGVISAAVDSAASSTSAGSDSPPESSSEPSTTTAPSAPASEPTPSGATAAVSDVEAAAAPTSSSDGATRRPSVPAASPERQPGGEPPPAKWTQVLENARGKEREITRAQVFQEYGLADGLDPVEVRAHLDLLRRDPQLHAELTLQALRRDGTYRPHDGDSPDQRLPQAPPALPDPALVSVDGQTAYSADQVLQVVNLALHNFRQQMSGELQPLQQMHHQARVAQIRADAQSYAGEAVREAQTWHRFGELTPRIR